YEAVRGADALEIEPPGGQRIRDGIEFAAYDVRRNIAVLKVPMQRADSLPSGGEVVDGQYAWSVAFPNCQTATATATRIHVASWPCVTRLAKRITCTGRSRSAPRPVAPPPG